MSRFVDLALDEQYDALSDLWLEELENGIPVDTIIRVIQILTDKGKQDLAGEFIELAIGEIKSSNATDIPILIKEIADCFHNNELIRRSLVEILRDEYILFRPLEYFLKESGLTAQDADITACWKEFRHLMCYSEGNYIYHHIYGAGKIKSVSRVFLSVDFPEYPEHDMRLASIIESKSAPPLNADSLFILRDYNPTALMDLFNDNPAEFLRRMIVEPIISNSTATRYNLAKILDIPEKSITQHWNKLKKVASLEANFSAPGDEIVFTKEDTSLAEQIYKIFKDNTVKMSVATKKISPLLKTASSEDWKAISLLLPDLVDAPTPEIGALFELCWLLSKRGTDAGFAEIQTTLFEPIAARALRALNEIRSIACSKKYVEYYLMSDAPGDEILKFFSSLQKSLWVHAAIQLIETNIEILKACIHLFLSNPADTDRYLRTLLFVAKHPAENLIAADMDIISLIMKNISFAGAEMQKKSMQYLLNKKTDEFNSWLGRQDTRKLENLLLQLEHSTMAQSEGFYLVINRIAAGRKASLGRSEISQAHFWESDWLFSSPAAIEKRKQDLLRLKDIEIPNAVEAISVAASHGDLKENAEYHAAIERRDLLLDRMKRWNSELKRYYPYPKERINDRVVSPCTSITLKNANGSNTIIDIVGPLDADLEEEKINYMAPIAQILLGKTVGDSVILPNNKDAESEIISIRVLIFSEIT